MKEENNKYLIEAKELIGTNIYLDIVSVGATINIMLVAVLAKGTTIIGNAAKEPEIVNVATFLNNMGAKVIGAGTSEIKIIGVDKLNSCYHEVIPDRIEAGTYMIAASLIGEEVKIENVIPEHVEALVSKLKEIGVDIEVGDDYFIKKKPKKFNSFNIKNLGYPGLQTYLQQPITTLLTQCEGVSMVEETIYENRFQNIPYLNKMGANIKIKGNIAYIKGSSLLYGKEVEATDLRAGACLIIAGLIAKGKTIIKNVNHILRGYEGIVDKLSNLGAKIKIE